MEQGIAQLVGQPWLKFRQLFKHAFRGRCAITIQNVSERLEIWKILHFIQQNIRREQISHLLHGKNKGSC